MLSRVGVLVLCIASTLCCAAGQEASSGFSLPVTLTGQYRFESPAGNDNRSAFSFRGVASPSLRLGEHWFLYSAFQANSNSYFAYQSGADSDRPVQFETLQAFVGYSRTISKASLLIEAGQLSSAFGIFPIDYDDAKMPLVNAPLSYTANFPIRADQLACGVYDILEQSYGGAVDLNCGGSRSERYGITPVTLFGLPAIEAQLSTGRFDARVQVSNSSPANPQRLMSKSQFAQATTGLGYSFPAGLHVGFSEFYGPYLDRNLVSLLPTSTTIRHFPAWGLGADLEWSRGPWSLQGEWQHFHFDLPNFVVSPSENAGYIQVKRVLSPRIFIAGRFTAQTFSPIQDQAGITANTFSGSQQAYEAVMGYRLNKAQLIKAEGEWLNQNAWAVGHWPWPQVNQYRFDLQLVTSVTAISKAFH